MILTTTDVLLIGTLTSRTHTTNMELKISIKVDIDTVR